MGQLPLQFAVSQGAASAAHSAAPSAATATSATLDSQGMSLPPCPSAAGLLR